MLAFDHQVLWIDTGLHGFEQYRPFSILSGFGSFFLPVETDFYLLTRVPPAPYLYRFIPLNNHVACENPGQSDLSPNGEANQK